MTKAGLAGVAISDYGGGVADLLNAFKERGQRKIGQLLATQIVAEISRPEADLVVAAPSSAKNFATRGFIPAEVIAGTLSRAWSIPVARLRLLQSGEDQAELDRSHRLSNLVGAMSALRPMIGRRVVLVDDIVTTGATLTEMARAVVAAGGQPIGFVTVAETIQKPRT